jgi:selenocysteine lyase/cysteine desulfurase
MVREWQVNPATAELERRDLEALLGPRTRLVAFTHCSNLVGSIHAVRELVQLVHDAGAWAFVDGVAFAPHGLPDLREIGADAYYFSLYKVYGPHLGAMFLRREVNAALPNQGHFFNEGKPLARFTPAGPDHAQVAAVNGVVDYLDAVADRHGHAGKPVAARAAAVRELFRGHETALLQPLLDFLAGHPRVRLIGRRQAAQRAPTVSFTVSGQATAEIGSELAAAKIGVGVGNFYAYRIMTALGIDPEDGAVRLSFLHYTSRDEVDRLVRELDRCLS